jgi:tetratricopeptide (TPR) repeat protein
MKTHYFRSVFLTLLILILSPNQITNAQNISSNQVLTSQLNLTGFYFLKNGSWDNAISKFMDCLKIDPKNTQATEGCGDVCFAKGDLQSAIKYYGLSIEYCATNQTAILNRGNAYRTKGNFDDAIRDFSRYVTLNKTNYTAYLYRASAYELEGEYIQSLADLDISLALNTNNPAAFYGRAQVYKKMRQYGLALDNFKTAISVSLTNADIYNDLAWLQATCAKQLIRNGQFAVENATRACDLTNWGKWEYIDTLAAALAERGDFDAAIANEKKALILSGNATGVVEILQAHIALYKNHQPYRDEH